MIRSAGVLGQTATVLERMRAEADAVSLLSGPLRCCRLRAFWQMVMCRRVGGAGEPAKREDFARMVFAWN
ncbi:MAG: hypothetical protein ACLU0O_00230 [Collinsella sp.]